MRLKILSWNIWYDGDLEQVNAFLEQSSADIIGLQEVMRIDGILQLSERLTKKLGYTVVYVPVIQIPKNGKTAEVGNAILSKHPIKNSITHDLSQTDDRIAMEAQVQVENKLLRVFCTHLVHTHQQPSQTQDTQAENLIKVLPKEMTIVMGDFNALPESNAIKKISAVLKNTDAQLLPTWSMYPKGCKTCLPQGIQYKLDNIFVSKDIETQSYRVENSKASDHLPISAVVEL